MDNINFIYLLYLFNTASVYFISYKDTLILADQRNYKLTKITFLAELSINVFQLIVLVVNKNFVLYILVKILVTLVQRLFINMFITKEYGYVNFKNKESINKKALSEIKTNVKAIFFHKIGYCLVSSTDNIIISSIFGIVKAGLYTNYLSLTTMVNSLLYSIFNGITSSFGNLAVYNDDEKIENVFNILNFLGFIVFGFTSICFFILLNDFIILWIGEDYLLPLSSVFIISVNFYITGIRYPLDTVKEASGIYDQDKYIPILQAVSNLFISIIVSLFIGFNGVLIGTTISTLLFPGWNRPYTVYKYVFKKKSNVYFKDYFCKVLFLIVTGFISAKITNTFVLGVGIISLIVKGFIIIVVYIILLFLCYRNNENLNFFINMFKNNML